MQRQRDTAEKFRALHARGQILILPNAWDAASAKLSEEAGAQAIATSSAALAWSHGYPDGEKLPPASFIAAVQEIVRIAKVPVSADSEMGFGDTPDGVVPGRKFNAERGDHLRLLVQAKDSQQQTLLVRFDGNPT